jgi:hypothetical protein
MQEVSSAIATLIPIWQLLDKFESMQKMQEALIDATVNREAKSVKPKSTAEVLCDAVFKTLYPIMLDCNDPIKDTADGTMTLQ